VAAGPEHANEVAAVAALTERVFAANRELAEIAAAIAAETMDFASRRARAQMEFVREMPSLGDLNGVVEAQRRYFERASRDYVEEFGKLSAVLLQAGNGAATGGRQP
jgi:hypothetical protein